MRAASNLKASGGSRCRFLVGGFHRELGICLLILAAFLPMSGRSAGTWSALSNKAPGGVALMLLLSDGTVMCQNSGNTSWYRLTPDIRGSYVNGTWTTLAPMHDSRRYYGSQVLRDGRVYVAGGEYGTGNGRMEIYNPVSNAWTAPVAVPNGPIDSCTEILSNGNVLQGNAGSDTRIFDVNTGTYSAAITALGGQDEPSWVKLQDGSILTLTDTNSERFIPSLNKWVADADLPLPLFGYGYEIGAALLLPNGKVFYIGGTSHTAIYTPWTTNAAGIYTPAGTTNAGVWTAGPDIPNSNAGVDAPAAMMVNGKILCCMADTNNGFGSGSTYYEYDYVANNFTQITVPTGGTSASAVAYGTTMLDLPDGTVLVSGFGTQLYSYKPNGAPLTNGMPTILGITTNLDGSYHLSGTLFNGISEGAAYGDDSQMNSDYPVARITNAAGNVFYCRTYNWSTCDLMTGTNVVTTEMTLPAGLLAGTYPLFVTANGISSTPYSLSIPGTPLPAVTGLAFDTIASNKMVFHWSAIGLTESAYVIQRSTDGVNYSTLATLATNLTTYTDNTVTPLGQYYYQVLGTNSFGLGNVAPAIFAASPPVVAVPAPWQTQDIGAVLGFGTSGTNSGVFTVIGSGGGIGDSSDQFQSCLQPMAGDVIITARVTASQNTGAGAMAGVTIRNSLASGAAGAFMAFGGGASNAVFQSRTSTGATTTSASGSGNLAVPYWVQLVRTGNTFTGYTSPDGVTWTQQGAASIVMEPVVYVGLAVSSGTYNLLNTSTFDNVNVTGLASAKPIPLAEWKLDETVGSAAVDSRSGNDGSYNNVILGQSGATPATGYSAGFNGTNADVSIPPLNLNSNVLTLTAWVNRNGTQNTSSAIFFNRANSTVSGLTFNNTTANELSYTWNNKSGTFGWHSGLMVPNNVWAFVALVIEPSRARIFMSTNGVLYSATNNVANAVQAFDGTSYIGWDTYSNTRYFNGQLDEVQFFNQALTPAQLTQMAASPVVSLTSPTNGMVVPVFTAVDLNVALSATNGHTLDSVQYFSDSGQLLGQASSSPYSTTTTNLNAGVYAIFARLFYDLGFSVDSTPGSVMVTVQPSTTNTWDADTLLSGSQDGNGSWGGGLTNWWNGSADVAWTDYSLAVFGSGTTTNCTVTLTNDVMPYAITFNTNAGGSYTLAGTNSIRLNIPGTPLTITANGNATISSPLQGNNALVKLGAGKLTLMASNNYAGVTVVAAGILKLGTNTAFGSGGNVTNTGTLDLNGQDFTASMFGRPVTLSGTGAGGTGAGGTAITNSSTIRAQLQDLELASDTVIASANTIFIGGTNAVNGILKLNGFTLTKVGSGTMLLNGVTLTGTGNLTVNAGTLQLMDAYGNNQQDTSLTGSGNFTIGSGASVMTYRWGSALTVSMPVILNGGTLGSGWPGPNGATFGCPILVKSNSIFNFNGGYDSCTFSGNITGGGGLKITGGSQTRTFTGTNSYGWTTISAGILQIGNAGTSGTLGLGPVTNNATLTFDRSDALAVSNLISGTGALIQSGTGTLTLFGTNLYTGGTTLAAGILNVSAPEIAGISGPLGETNSISFTGGTLQYSAVNAFDYSSRFSKSTNQNIRVDTAGQSVTFAAALTSTNGGSLAKLGAGTLTLAGTNTFDGTTVINAGTLLVNGLLPVGTVTVATNAVLGGGGKIFGPTIIQPGGRLQPGSGTNIATLIISNNLSLAGELRFTLNRTNVQPASQIIGLRTLACGGTLTVTNLGPNNFSSGDTFTLFQATNYTGNFTSLTLPVLAAGLVWNTGNLSVNGTISVTNLACTLTYTAGAHGAISGASVQTVAYGTGGSAVTAVPDASYHFAIWSDGNLANPRTDANVTNNVSVTASFATNSVAVMPVITTGTLFLTHGAFTLMAIGGAGQPYILLTTTNLGTPWDPIATNVTGADGTCGFTNATVTTGQQFYRLRSP